MGKCRKGFTTIELIVAISILVVLMSMVMIGFGVLGDSGKKNDTKVALEAAKSLLAELEASGGMSRVKDLYLQGSNDFWEKGIMAPPPGSNPVLEGPTNLGKTAYVMIQLAAMPNNRKALEGLPPERTTTLAVRQPGQNKDTIVTILLDGWGNPILFVPKGGMKAVRYSNDPSQPKTVTSGGIINPGEPLPPGARGFFVSAGPDGIYGANEKSKKLIPGGDDNIYSFEN